MSPRRRTGCVEADQSAPSFGVLGWSWLRNELGLFGHVRCAVSRFAPSLVRRFEDAAPASHFLRELSLTGALGMVDRRNSLRLLGHPAVKGRATKAVDRSCVMSKVER